MSQFEFIFVLISIIAGLALAQLLSGLARQPRNSIGQIDIAHAAFSTATISSSHIDQLIIVRTGSPAIRSFVPILALMGQLSIFFCVRHI